MELTEVQDPGEMSDDDAAGLTRCRVEVTDAGGAVARPPRRPEQLHLSVRDGEGLEGDRYGHG